MQEKIIILREKHNHSIKFVADYLGISTKQYRAKEKGEYPFDLDEMFKLAKLYGETISNIFLPRSNRNGNNEKETV